ncbi:hypothetical protein M5689_006833 [Euphorbia peplus]|nr:hypothetical protein M5689_006833 [Euphorbia peplus]
MPQIREENLEEGDARIEEPSEAASQIPEENLEEGHVANTPPANQDKETTANEAEETTAGIELPSEAVLLRLRRMLGWAPATIIPHQRTHKRPKFFTPSEYEQPKSKYW